MKSMAYMSPQFDCTSSPRTSLGSMKSGFFRGYMKILGDLRRAGGGEGGLRGGGSDDDEVPQLLPSLLLLLLPFPLPLLAMLLLLLLLVLAQLLLLPGVCVWPWASRSSARITLSSADRAGRPCRCCPSHHHGPEAHRQQARRRRWKEDDSPLRTATM